MPIYQGSCHCGAVRFEVETVLDKATSCNCSICTRKGALHHRVAPENFHLHSGQADLTLYQAGDKTAKHWFCKHCGMHPFSNPRAAPEMVSINLHCLDNFWEIAGQIEIREFDGQNWEEAVKVFRF